MILTKSSSLTKNKQTLAALAMDLRRAALGYHRGSLGMAKRFWIEALKRREELDMALLKPYVQKYLKKLDYDNSTSAAEDMLMYSIIFQNAAV